MTITNSPHSVALQDLYTPANRCFGCGPASEVGLRIKSYVEDGKVVSRWQPDIRYETVYGILSGGIISSLLECQGSWATGVALMVRDQLSGVPWNFVTKEMTVRFRRPVYIIDDSPVELTSVLVDGRGRELIAEAELTSGGDVCARARVTSVVIDTEIRDERSGDLLIQNQAQSANARQKGTER
jgi:acyl-coenzyme A thioesterase PaaI-like protein